MDAVTRVIAVCWRDPRVCVHWSVGSGPRLPVSSEHGIRSEHAGVEASVVAEARGEARRLAEEALVRASFRRPSTTVFDDQTVMKC